MSLLFVIFLLLLVFSAVLLVGSVCASLLVSSVGGLSLHVRRLSASLFLRVPLGVRYSLAAVLSNVCYVALLFSVSLASLCVPLRSVSSLLCIVSCSPVVLSLVLSFRSRRWLVFSDCCIARCSVSRRSFFLNISSGFWSVFLGFLGRSLLSLLLQVHWMSSCRPVSLVFLCALCSSALHL